MSARVELTAMFAPFLSGTVLEEAVGEAYALVLNEAADKAESLRQFEKTSGPRKSAQVSENVGILRVADALRAMAAAPVVPVPDTTGDEGELARLRELERRVTEQLEDFEEGLEEDPGAPAVARNMVALLARAVRGGQS